ncbi:MAG: DUF4249 family protein [Saprospirales bacterium]|nr:DUF4249 family protein [Saprospirales bacterium]MBK8922971.1 DUF4249 family protein [Saprospirales bacterium]
MKKLFFLLPLAAALLPACSNDFEVAAPWKEIPVAYAILSPKDTAQYIRVEKAFLDPETSALQLAQIADSLYYPESAISVFLEQLSTGQRIPLQRVDGNLEGYVRQGGIFATQPNWLYKTKAQINEGETYRLLIIRNDGRPDITAETVIPREFILRHPDPADIPPQITFKRDVSPTVDWRTDAAGVFFNLHFRIRYRENGLNGALIKRDTLQWTVTPNVKRSSQLVAGNLYKGEFLVSTESFFNFLVQHIPPASDRFRYFEGIDVTLEGGGAEIERYLETAAANSGITGAEIIPAYSNLSEGYGIFTAKNRVVLNKVRVTPETIDDLNEQAPTNALNFRY